MDPYKVSSTNQSGGFTVGQINIDNRPSGRPSPRRRIWRLIVAIGVVIAIFAGIAEILGYLNIVPNRNAPTPLPATRTQVVPVSPVASEPKPVAQKKMTKRVTMERTVPDEQKSSGPTFNVTSNNQTGGITAGQINMGPPQRHLDSVGERWLLSIPKAGPPVEITAMMGDQESYLLAREIEVFLRAQGYNVRGIGQMIFQPPIFGVGLNPHSEWTNIVVGYRGG